MYNDFDGIEGILISEKFYAFIKEGFYTFGCTVGIVSSDWVLLHKQGHHEVLSGKTKKYWKPPNLG